MPIQKFKPVIKRARFDAPGFQPIDMQYMGNMMLQNSIFPRLDKAMDVYDNSAPPLKPRYQKWKIARYGSGLRDLKASGRTRRGTRVIEAGQRGGQNPYSYVKLGFSDPEALLRVIANRRIIRQWGISPNDREYFVRMVQERVGSTVAVVTKVA